MSEAEEYENEYGYWYDEGCRKYEKYKKLPIVLKCYKCEDNEIDIDIDYSLYDENTKFIIYNKDCLDCQYLLKSAEDQCHCHGKEDCRCKDECQCLCQNDNKGVCEKECQCSCVCEDDCKTYCNIHLIEEECNCNCHDGQFDDPDACVDCMIAYAAGR